MPVEGHSHSARRKPSPISPTARLEFGTRDRPVPGCVIGAAVSAGLGGRSRIETFPEQPPPPALSGRGADDGFCGGFRRHRLDADQCRQGHLGLIIAVAGFLTGMKLATSSFGRRLQPA